MNPLAWLNTSIGELQRRFPALRRLDDAPWKTWVWHTVFATCGALASRAILGLALPGAVAMAALYVAREEDQASPDLVDAFLDVLGPTLVMLACVAWRL